MASPRVGARVREGTRTGVVVELRPQGMVDVRFEDRGIVERRPAARLALANPSPRAAKKPSGSRGKAAPAPEMEVYDPTLEQFRSVVQGIYESLVCKETGAKAFKTATGLRADRKLSQATIRSLLSKAHAIATRVGQRHGYLEAGSQRPTLKGAALSAARYGADSRFVEKMLGEDAAGKKLAAGKSAATRASNREDYEKTLQLARKEQKPRRVLEQQGGQLRLLSYPRKPNPTPWEARGERSVVAGSGATLPPEMRAYSDKARELGQGHGQALRALAHAKDKKPLLATAADFEHRMRLLIREATDSVDPMSPVWWEDNGKPTSRLRTALGTLNAVYVRTSEDVLAGRVRNPGIGIHGIGYAGTGGASKGSGSGEYTPTTFYAVPRTSDKEDGIGYYLVTFDPKVRKVREALSRVGGWQLDRSITSTEYETGRVSPAELKDADKIHTVKREVRHVRGGKRPFLGGYFVDGPKAKPGARFAVKAEADEYARWLDAEAASFLVPKVHEVSRGRYVSGDPEPYYKVTDLNGNDLEDEVASRQKKLAIMEGRGDTLREDSDLWAELIYPDEASARAAAKALDWRAANTGAMPLVGYRTKKGLSGGKATELYEKTILAFEGRVPYVLHATLRRGETPSTVRTYKRADVLSAEMVRAFNEADTAANTLMLEALGLPPSATPDAVRRKLGLSPSVLYPAIRLTEAEFAESLKKLTEAARTKEKEAERGRKKFAERLKKLPPAERAKAEKEKEKEEGDDLRRAWAKYVDTLPAKERDKVRTKLGALREARAIEPQGALVLAKASTTAEEARRKKHSVERLRTTFLGRGESAEKLADITEEAVERGRKKLRNKILRIAKDKAVQAVKQAAPGRYAAVMEKPRAEIKMRFRKPGAFDVPGRAFGEESPSGATKLADDWEHLSANLWPKGNIPEKFQPAYTREMLDDLDIDDLREIATSADVGLTPKEVTALLTADERNALAKVLAERGPISPLAHIEAGTERGERRYKPPKPIREAQALPLPARGAPSRKVAQADSEGQGLSAADRRRLAELQKELDELLKMRKNGAVSTGVRFAKSGGELALRYGGKAAQAAKGWAASAEGKRAITRIAMTAASLFGAKAVESGKLSASQARLVQQELERQTGHKADPADVALALQLASK